MIIRAQLGATLVSTQFRGAEGYTFIDGRTDRHMLNAIIAQIGDNPRRTLLSVMRYIPDDITGAYVKRAGDDADAVEIWLTPAVDPTVDVAHFCLVFKTDAPVTDKEKALKGLELLQQARDLFKEADNQKTVDRIRAAISSAKGAVRIQTGRAVRRQLDAAA